MHSKICHDNVLQSKNYHSNFLSFITAEIKLDFYTKEIYNYTIKYVYM